MELAFNLGCWVKRHDYEVIQTSDRFITTKTNLYGDESTRKWKVIFFKCKVCGRRESSHDHPKKEGRHDPLELARDLWEKAGKLPGCVKPEHESEPPSKIESLLQSALTCHSVEEADNFLKMARRHHRK